MADSRAEAALYRMILEYLVVSESKEMFKMKQNQQNNDEYMSKDRGRQLKVLPVAKAQTI